MKKEPTFLDEFIVHYRNKSILVEVHDTISKTQRVNRFGYNKTVKILQILGIKTHLIGNKKKLKLNKKG